MVEPGIFACFRCVHGLVQKLDLREVASLSERECRTRWRRGVVQGERTVDDRSVCLADAWMRAPARSRSAEVADAAGPQRFAGRPTANRCRTAADREGRARTQRRKGARTDRAMMALGTTTKFGDLIPDTGQYPVSQHGRTTFPEPGVQSIRQLPAVYPCGLQLGDYWILDIRACPIAPMFATVVSFQCCPPKISVVLPSS